MQRILIVTIFAMVQAIGAYASLSAARADAGVSGHTLLPQRAAGCARVP